MVIFSSSWIQKMALIAQWSRKRNWAFAGDSDAGVSDAGVSDLSAQENPSKRAG